MVFLNSLFIWGSCGFQFPADLVTLTEEILNGKLQFQLKVTILSFWTKIDQERVFPFKNRESGHHF